MKLFIILLIIGVFQCWLGHFINIHDGLEHMQYGYQWGLYVLETLFYMGYYFLLYLWLTKSNSS